jgi:DNA repair protein RecO (recombination protein O)
MQWTSEAIIIKQQKFSDDKLLCWLLSSTHGVYKGLLTLNKKTRSQIQVGNIVNATWRARLQEHLGSYYCELIKPLPMAVINSKLKLSSIASLCSILSSSLPERVLEAKLYDSSVSYLLTLKDHNNWLIEYIKLELLLLQEMGYGLKLDICALSGEKDNLYYISPKTGAAVTKEAGSPYHDKLFKLPGFLKNEEIEKEDIINAFKITEHFLRKRLYDDKELPGARVRFAELVESNL